jgi:hypothetical protein
VAGILLPPRRAPFPPRSTIGRHGSRRSSPPPDAVESLIASSSWAWRPRGRAVAGHLLPAPLTRIPVLRGLPLRPLPDALRPLIAWTRSQTPPGVPGLPLPERLVRPGLRLLSLFLASIYSAASNTRIPSKRWASPASPRSSCHRSSPWTGQAVARPPLLARLRGDHQLPLARHGPRLGPDLAIAAFSAAPRITSDGRGSA